MGKFLSAAWVIFFLAARGLLLFNTDVDLILLLAGALFFWGQADGDLEVVEAYYNFHRENIKKEGAKNANDDRRI